jgi:hypothetical protein
MFNPIAYLIENISWYEPIYNIAWVLFMLYALTLPLLLLAIFKIHALQEIQPTQSWTYHFQTYRYLFGAALVVFSFRLIPYWIFNDKILHFLGGGIAIALIYEYFVINFNLDGGRGIFNLSRTRRRKSVHLTANLLLLLMFASCFSVFSELYEFISKYIAGYQFDSSGLDTWVDIMANLGGAFLGYFLIWLWKYGRKPMLVN